MSCGEKKVTKKVRHAFLFGLDTADFGPIYGTGLHIALGLLIESNKEKREENGTGQKQPLWAVWYRLVSGFSTVVV